MGVNRFGHCLTLFIWIGVNVANADITVGLTPLYKICNFKLNSLILNNNQPISFLFIWDIIRISIISQVICFRLSSKFHLRRCPISRDGILLNFFLKMNYLFHHRADGAVFIDQLDFYVRFPGYSTKARHCYSYCIRTAKSDGQF